MSNMDAMNITADAQLFTELTSEQAAVVEGGATLKLYSIKALKAGADLIGPDDTYMRVNGHQIWGVYKMKTGQTRTINKFVDFSDRAFVQLFDRDLGKDDYLGGFQASTTPTGRPDKPATAFLSGSGSRYEISYAVSA
jgi:hypothetical protein